MLKKIIISLSLISYPLTLLADQIKLNDNAPKTHVVVKGDTLWDISEVFLEQPWLWPKLWRLNPEVNNPHLIYPGDILRLVYDENGNPMLVVDKGANQGKASYKWSPKIRQENKDDSAISLLPLEVVAPYMTYAHLFSEDELEELPYVIGSDEGYRMTTKDFKVYVNADLEVSQSYAMYDKGEELFDPETEESLGFYVDLVGTGQAIKTGDMENNVPATIHVSSVKREIAAGSYVVPINDGQLLPSVFSMKAAKKSLRGSIVKATSDARRFGKLEIIMINRGAEHDVTTGDVMGIKRTSPGVVDTGDGPAYLIEASSWDKLTGSDYKMPEEYLGELMIFKVFEKASMGIILQTEKPARINDIITVPE
ncbi:LysM peptidoglycan-binding domain-containing protein [Colwellia sp. E2M01]|uniref:LysM peptidoglycan-binding domain-containing protein n=1 Tax=Colwellia sp. E2M01 TaxID=2841561 RepID=UPI001C086EC4|nr:LysM peptidoglycan-binding domain-containing protein [Colwellia sp. E2M01]MBU2870987.1 LysM peptidoglycan-binding domain-containing protein [Colwellia sp. E2M01]